MRQQRGPIDHGGVDDLALTRSARLEQSGHDAEGQQHAAPTEVPEES